MSAPNSALMARLLAGEHSDFNKYILVGCLAFAVDTGMLMLLLQWEMQYLLANTIAFLTANVFNFFLGHFMIFKGSNKRSMVHIYIMVLAVSIMGLLLNNVSMFILVDFFVVPILVAKVLATIVCLSWNFLGRKRFAYD